MDSSTSIPALGIDSIIVGGGEMGARMRALDWSSTLGPVERWPLARSEGGLGIGLTLVHRLVEQHGGTITATSPGVGKGSASEGHELSEYGGTAVAITPGWLRSEMMLDISNP